MNTNDTLRLYATGDAFKEGKFNLRETVKLLDITRMMLDTALLSSLDRNRMTAQLKDAVDYEISIKSGSIEAYINLSEHAVQAIPLLAPVSADLMGHLQEILSYIKNCKSIIEWLGEKRQKGITVKVKNSPNATVLVASNGDVYNTTDNELYGSLRLFRPLKQFTRLCDGKRIEVVQFFEGIDSANDDPSFAIDPSLKDLYRTESATESLTISIVGVLFDLNTKNRKGRLETGDGNSVNIQVAPSLDIHQFSDSVYDKGAVEFSARPLMKVINGVSTMSGYELVDFTPPRQVEMNV